MSLYDGSTFKFYNFTMALPNTSTITLDLKANSQRGTYSYGGGSGDFSGSIRVIGDQFCHTEGSHPEHCVFVYTDGEDIYEVNAQGVVESKNQKQ